MARASKQPTLPTPDVPVVLAQHGFDVAYPKPKPLEDLEIPDPPLDAQRLVIDGADVAEGFRGIASFDYSFNYVSECQNDSECILSGECLENNTCRIDIEPGDYLREVRVALNVEEDSNVFLFNGYASNSSTFLTFFGLRYRFVGEAVWVGADVTKSENRIAQTFRTGSLTLPLP